MDRTSYSDQSVNETNANFDAVDCSGNIPFMVKTAKSILTHQVTGLPLSSVGITTRLLRDTFFFSWTLSIV